MQVDHGSHLSQLNIKFSFPSYFTVFFTIKKKTLINSDRKQKKRAPEYGLTGKHFRKQEKGKTKGMRW